MMGLSSAVCGKDDGFMRRTVPHFLKRSWRLQRAEDRPDQKDSFFPSAMPFTGTVTHDSIQHNNKKVICSAIIKTPTGIPSFKHETGARCSLERFGASLLL
jgi:hypothetical protein